MADRSGSASRKHKWLSPPEMSPSKYLRSSESRRVSHSRERDAESPSPSQDRRVTYHPHQSTPRRRLEISTGVRSTVRARSRQIHSTETEEEAPHQEGERSNDPNRRSSRELQRPRTPKDGASSLLFQKAFSAIMGTPGRSRRSLDSAVTRSLEEKKAEKKIHSDPEESPTTHSTPKSTPSAKEAVRERKWKSEEIKRAPSPKRSIASVIIKREAVSQQGAPRLVFIDEDSDKDVDNTTDVTEKDPSIGSDFSDIEDIEPLARFSQDDVVSPFCCSIPDDPKPFSSYKSPLSCYTDLTTSSPMYRPPAEHNTWRQKEQDKSFVSETSLLDSDCESPMGKGQVRSDSVGPPWIFGNTSRSVRRTLEILPSTTTDSKYKDGGFIDTHCHLDMLFSRLSHRSSFADLREQYSSTFPQEFHGCITDYCDPRTLKRLPWQQVLNEDMVWGAFGCHPHFAQYYDNRQHEDMMMALRHPKAIAFGEMGLDYSHKCSTSVPEQISVPKRLCKFAHPGLAIHTIHEIARLRHVPVKTVMSKLRENTYRIYSV
ncbi:hypothetical protein GDO81_027234 [Engystomops pustulosus]|uniref:Uncharacterized protein n=1 Tax=Engystomops pustulosus TaxID=76066 RepID=A0AAV6ZMP9_ENGPU|nr:hypothetical protein GDO81_027234 [Engystomops pustulosus]